MTCYWFEYLPLLASLERAQVELNGGRDARDDDRALTAYYFSSVDEVDVALRAFTLL
jgi:hypothetical protein